MGVDGGRGDSLGGWEHQPGNQLSLDAEWVAGYQTPGFPSALKQSQHQVDCHLLNWKSIDPSPPVWQSLRTTFSPSGVRAPSWLDRFGHCWVGDLVICLLSSGLWAKPRPGVALSPKWLLHGPQSSSTWHMGARSQRAGTLAWLRLGDAVESPQALDATLGESRQSSKTQGDVAPFLQISWLQLTAKIEQLRECLSVCVCVCMYVCVYICMCAAYGCEYMFKSAFVCICLGVCMFLYVHNTHVYVYFTTQSHCLVRLPCCSTFRSRVAVPSLCVQYSLFEVTCFKSRQEWREKTFSPLLCFFC